MKTTPRTVSGCLLVDERVSGSASNVHFRRFQNDAGAQAGDHGVEGIAREQIRILAGAESIREPQRRNPEQPRDEEAHGDDRLHGRREDARLHAPLELGDDVPLRLVREREAFVLAADPRDRAVEKHQREVLRVLATELVDAPEDRADSLQRVEALELLAAALVGRMPEQAEALLSQGEEDVVFAREITVYRCRA